MMQVDAPLPIRSIGDEVAYSDNAEDAVLEILTRVSDPSDGSDELAAEIGDWPTHYHCSPQRSNILRLFRIEPGTSVLEIGAGTGALTRYLAERGAVVTALEGTRARAESIAMRCRGMESVEVVCGDFKNFEPSDTFDIVLVVGVLEYAASDAGGRSAPSSFLDRVVACLKPRGVVILAIENQLGLKYLLGGKEDHLGRAWVGIEGYPGDHGVRTWGRHNLREMLSGSGLSAQRWFFPFPDYKTPSSIVSKAAYGVAEAPTLIDQFAAPPIIDYADPERPVRDDRAAHRVFLGEDIGPDVANSFLVAATRENGNLGAIVDPDTLLWHFGGNRRRDRRRVTTVSRTTDDGLWVRSRAVSPNPATSQDSWVSFHPDRDQPYVEGPNLEQAILDACRRGSSTGVGELLDLWWRHLVALERPFEGPLDRSHPFLSASTKATLEPNYLDVQPSNFIPTDDGLVFIDREWVAEPVVDADMVRLRALWYLARTLIMSGAPLPWPIETSVESLATQWMSRWKTAPETAMFTTLYSAEAVLQLEVSGGIPETLESALKIQGRMSRKNVLAGQILGRSASETDDLVGALQAAMGEARQYQHSLENRLDEAKSYTLNLEAQIDHQRQRGDQAEQHFQAAQSMISNLEHQASQAVGHIGRLEQELGEAAGHIEKVEETLSTVLEDVAHLQAIVRSKDSDIASLGHDLETGEISLTQTRSRLVEAETWRREFERHPLVRFYRRLRWWLPQ